MREQGHHRISKSCSVLSAVPLRVFLIDNIRPPFLFVFERETSALTSAVTVRI